LELEFVNHVLELIGVQGEVISESTEQFQLDFSEDCLRVWLVHLLDIGGDLSDDRVDGLCNALCDHESHHRGPDDGRGEGGDVREGGGRREREGGGRMANRPCGGGQRHVVMEQLPDIDRTMCEEGTV
jgi:hypothetical protein